MDQRGRRQRHCATAMWCWSLDCFRRRPCSLWPRLAVTKLTVAVTVVGVWPSRRCVCLLLQALFGVKPPRPHEEAAQGVGCSSPSFTCTRPTPLPARSHQDGGRYYGRSSRAQHDDGVTSNGGLSKILYHSGSRALLVLLNTTRIAPHAPSGRDDDE